MTSSPLVDREALAERIRAVGLKVTAPRLAVLKMLDQAAHSSADQVFGAVREELPGTSTQAIYGVLSAFAAAGLVRRFDPAGSPALYESRAGDNHHHVVCVRCGDLRDVDCVIGEAPCLTPSDTSGFSVFAAEVTFTGLCADCQKVNAELEAS
ncbi:Fur family transcriptional regulator [Agreia sp. COWG]|uniref:Fur family transcriptional regulator n=1 Tax=Agreia sp. COWG TaxID=2773266 RepID=UPI0019262C1D|nr:Fur family transcriptional regulator [Agreia sp. COWG]